ncbi:conserved hypothetical protein, membrane [Candidatus Magnetomorum sp. HK-1]|nr:conserved hypothetical protein, membrane [Candidatus Magnetomorum sp. HK-1]
MKVIFKSVYLCLFVFIYSIITSNSVSALEAGDQINLKIIDRLARIEEGQKTIISEMQTRFEAVDKRFEAVDKRFEAVDKRFDSILREMNQRFESVDKRFESVDKRFESMLREMNQRFESVDRQISQLGNHVSQLGNYIIAIMGMIITIFLAIVGYAIWEKKKDMAKEHEKNEQEHFSPLNTQKKVNQMIDIMKQMSEKFPEMRSMMHAAQLL